jgi:hypothetical protein
VRITEEDRRPRYSGGRRVPPFSLRLSFEERTKLERAAGDLPVAAYIKSILFGTEPLRVARRRTPIKDHQALAEVLACLGSSRIANNLNQLAKAANSGSLYFDQGTKAALNAACGDIRAMRQLLMQALGMRLGDEAPARQSPSQGFERAAFEGVAR